MNQRMREEYTSVYRNTYVLVLAYVQRRLWDRDKAEDIVAEAYRVSWTKALEGQLQTLPQLYAICRNLIGDNIRGYEKTQSELALIRPLQRDYSTENKAFDEAFELLSRPEQEVLELKYWELLSASEISIVVGCSEEAAWTRLSRARKNLKDHLQKAGIGNVSK